MAKKIEVKQVDGLVESLEKNFKKLPTLPAGGREFLVMVAPWVVVVIGVLSIVFGGLGALLSLLGSITILLGTSPIALIVSLLTAVLALVSGVLLVLSFKPLKNKEMYGWKLLTYVIAVNIVSFLVSLVNVFMSLGAAGSVGMVVGPMVAVWSVFWTVVWLAVEFYILFQIKSHYK